MTELEQKKEYEMQVYNRGKVDGAFLANRKLTIELANLYNAGWYRRGAKIKAYIDGLWEQYGPKYDDE